MLLEVENLYAGYGKIEALHGISFHVNKGEIVTLIGANGAGKSTTLKAVMRLTPPESPTVISGDIRFNGESILKTEPHHVVARLKMDLVPEGRHIFGNLTVNENLKLATWTRKDNNIQRDVDKVFELFPRLKERMPPAILQLSKRFLREPEMLAIAQKTLTVPAIEQVYYEVRPHQKMDALCRVLDAQGFRKALVFCSTKRSVDEVTAHLQQRGYQSDGLHGDLAQSQRDRVMMYK